MTCFQSSDFTNEYDVTFLIKSHFWDDSLTNDIWMTEVLLNITTGYFNCNEILVLSNSCTKIDVENTTIRNTFLKFK